MGFHPDDNLKKLPKELEGLHEKYSATCRLFKYQELVSATSNFLASMFSIHQSSATIYFFTTVTGSKPLQHHLIIMQTLLLPATRSGISVVAVGPLLPPHRFRPPLTFSPPNFLTSLETRNPKPLCSPLASWKPLDVKRSKLFLSRVSSSSVSSPSFTSSNDGADKAKLAQVAKRLETTARYFKRLGNLGFWGQLVCTVVSAVILSFSVVVTGKITSPATFYATASGIFG